MNLRHTARISSVKVAENIITCFSNGQALKIYCTSLRMSISWRTLSHSSKMKNLVFFRIIDLRRIRVSMRPGVPTTIWGGSFARAFSYSAIGFPPKITVVLILRYLVKRLNSLLIWKASSRVWHIIIAENGSLSGSMRCNNERTKTAVLPIPDLAWHRISTPIRAIGRHSCWTKMAQIDPIRIKSTFWGVLKATIRDGSKKLRFQKKVLETCGVDGRVGISPDGG